MSTEGLVTCDYEVFGRVQGVFFRKYTANQAKSLGLNGWVMNTDAGTVKGQLEGPEDKVNEMKKWLEFTGSPSSRIDRAVFTPTTPVNKAKFTSFAIKR
ncbi:unnamed protein product [Hermetia illucens]|uniref:Acylphosphatase n=2 Tax=Hermetia illucens TaxID=343691 RepID=A0A7R8V3M0_HERIL|nr:unnamed protein product [Hermetia illucens]